jgi:hypothetical protein
MTQRHDQRGNPVRSTRKKRSKAARVGVLLGAYKDFLTPGKTRSRHSDPEASQTEYAKSAVGVRHVPDSTPSLFLCHALRALFLVAERDGHGEIPRDLRLDANDLAPSAQESQMRDSNRQIYSGALWDWKALDRRIPPTLIFTD